MHEQVGERGAGELSWWVDGAVFLVALAALAACMIFLHALSSLHGNDEASHFLNSYLVWAYSTEAAGQNPMAYATEFYVHYPKISIGHWPPLYYALLSVFFFIDPYTPQTLLLVNLLVNSLPALLIARLVRPLAGLPWAVLAGLIFVLHPLSIDNTSRLMLDQALAGVCLAAAVVWSAYASRPSLWSGLAYAILAAAAILIKGNGWVLAIYPLFHIALAGRWCLLTNWRTYVAGLTAIVAVAPWTVLTYKIGADGFNYAWGLDYFTVALPYFLLAIFHGLGPIATMAAVAGMVGCLRARDNRQLREWGAVGMAMVLATILFHSIVPVDLEPRYMSSAMPPLAAFAALGVWMTVIRLRVLAVRPLLACGVALAVFAIPGLLFLGEHPSKMDMRMDEVAAFLASQPKGQVVVVDGHPGAEGSLAAAVALSDRSRRNYVVRSSQLMAQSNFMGSQYTLKVKTPQEALALLKEVSAGTVVIAEGPRIVPRFPHSDLLLAALQLDGAPFRLEQVLEHRHHDGRTLVFVRESLPDIRLDAVRRVNFPAKAPM